MKKLLLAALMSTTLLSPAVHAQSAENYPSQPLRFIVPLGPGSGADTNTRALADGFQKVAGQPVVVENRPGADLILGTTTALNAPADGYTMVLITPSAPIINPLFQKELPYKPEDIRPILHLTNNVGVLVTAVDSRFNSLKDVLDEAGKAPETVSMGLYGNTYRLGARVLAKQAGVQFNDIPYKGFGPTINDVVGRTVDVALVDLGGALPLIQAGKLKALAIGSEERLDIVPDVPTVAESGFPGYSLYIFVGYGIHADTPEPIASKLEDLLQQVTQEQAFQDGLTRHAGTLFVGSRGKQFAEFIESEFKKAKEVVTD
ncbi:tripartite tricarboxylate transporter substrate binding protein [Alcaligenaceae bacterium]|nr:tripartite tricarboxylate transporter substrate binding protein [Alcaligenaceae bacterium]